MKSPRRESPDSTPNIARAAINDFDASDPVRVMAWDEISTVYGDLPDVYGRWRIDWRGHPAGDDLPLRTISMIIAPETMTWRYTGADDELAHDLRNLRDAVRLPIGDVLAEHLQLAVTALEDEARRRIESSRRREVRGDRYPDWRAADLLAEVEAVCGAGKKAGRQWRFVCPFHADHDPSLTVDPIKRCWYCWPCARGGGVVAWRQAVAE